MDQAYFHKKVAIHTARNKILSIHDSQGVRHDNYEEVKTIAVNYFKSMLGASSSYPSDGYTRSLISFILDKS